MALGVQRLLAKYLLRSGRGTALVNHVTDLPKDALDGVVYLFAIEGLFNTSVPVEFLFIIVVVKKVIEYGIGTFDEKIGFWKIQNEYSSRQLNPFNQEMLKRIQNIEDCVCGKR
ncbi:MAG: hypothetical protein KAJ93_02370 [Methanosarcinales archaeon]|nr:hypothetical protein [Methanosarcinales archaeon]